MLNVVRQTDHAPCKTPAPAAAAAAAAAAV